MNTEVFDLNIDEIELITGAGDAKPLVEVIDPDDYPVIINNPP